MFLVRVFHHTAYAWGLGAPDIVPMFSDSLSQDRMTALMYDPDREDFTADANYLDTWVFDHWLQDVLHNQSGTTLFFSLSSHSEQCTTS